MKASHAAAMADRLHERMLRPLWGHPPPPKQRSPALAPTSNRAEFLNKTDNETTLDTDHAQLKTRAAVLDREADALLFLGRHGAAERLSHRAAEMRGEAAA